MIYPVDWDQDQIAFCDSESDKLFKDLLEKVKKDHKDAELKSVLLMNIFTMLGVFCADSMRLSGINVETVNRAMQTMYDGIQVAWQEFAKEDEKNKLN